MKAPAKMIRKSTGLNFTFLTEGQQVLLVDVTCPRLLRPCAIKKVSASGVLVTDEIDFTVHCFSNEELSMRLVPEAIGETKRKDFILNFNGWDGRGELDDFIGNGPGDEEDGADEMADDAVSPLPAMPNQAGATIAATAANERTVKALNQYTMGTGRVRETDLVLVRVKRFTAQLRRYRMGYTNYLVGYRVTQRRRSVQREKLEVVGPTGKRMIVRGDYARISQALGSSQWTTPQYRAEAVAYLHAASIKVV